MQNGFEWNYSYVYKPFATEFLDFFRIKTSSTALIFSSIEYFGFLPIRKTPSRADGNFSGRTPMGVHPFSYCTVYFRRSISKLSDVFSIQGLQFVGFLTNLQLL